jgi:CheY-like chemotaxis protein
MPETIDEKTNLILIAEDDQIGYLLLSNFLKKAGYVTIRAVNGKEAVDHCRNNHMIKIVLMDINMPVMDGFEATRMIKSFRKDLPVIAVTAYTMDKTREIAMEAGCDDYLPKPVDKAVLVEMVEALVPGLRGLK